MEFNSRLTPPSLLDKNWINTAYGGKSPCIVIHNQSNGYTLPNCVGYAFGRFMEILGSYPKISAGNAGTWYLNTSDGYTRSQVPQVGAVACWSNPGQPGHVAIVEQVNSDGSILVSESGYTDIDYVQILQQPYFWLSTIYPPFNRWGTYVFQGFIYNPACLNAVAKESKLNRFINTAQDHVGDKHDWVCSVTGIARSQPWSAAFIAACAQSVPDTLGKVIPKNTFNSVSAIARLGVSQKLGTWHSNTITPQIGDLLFTRYSEAKNSEIQDKYTSSKVGIVTQVEGRTITCIMGDVNNKVSICYYQLGEYSINGYYRPNWSNIGSSQSDIVYAPLYTDSTTRNDAVIREVGYLNSQLEPSIFSSDIKLSVINYTGLVGGMYEFLASRLGSSLNTSVPDIDIDGQYSIGDNQIANLQALPENAAIVIRYLENKGFKTSAAVGIAANIQHESGFNPASRGDMQNGVYTSFGICQWHNERGNNMKNFVGSGWETNLTGQLDFLWSELVSGYVDMVAKFKVISNNLYGAKDAAEMFVRRFERPAHQDDYWEDKDGDGIDEFYKGQVNIRRSSAEKIWNQIVIQVISL